MDYTQYTYILSWKISTYLINSICLKKDFFYEQRVQNLNMNVNKLKTPL